MRPCRDIQCSGVISSSFGQFTTRPQLNFCDSHRQPIVCRSEMRPEHRDQLGEDCFPPHRRSPRSKSRTRRQSRRGTLYYSGARCDYSAKDVRLCIPSPRSLGGLPQPTSDSLRGCRAESWAWRSCTEFPSPAIRRGRPNRLRDNSPPRGFEALVAKTLQCFP